MKEELSAERETAGRPVPFQLSPGAARRNGAAKIVDL